MRAADYIDDLAANGRYTFTTADAVNALGGSLPAVRASLRRLKEKGKIADPHQGFHVVVPPEYRRLGCLPPDQFVPQLMEHLKEPYYVALLSAAELHGAAHQRPQTFQVMVRKNRRPIECGAARVQFIARKDMDPTSVVSRKTPRGLLNVASPEVTALELTGYADQSGGLNNVAAVVSELAEAIDKKKLAKEAVKAPIAWSQRLGYLLDVAGEEKMANAIAPIVHDRAKVFASLAISRDVCLQLADYAKAEGVAPEVNSSPRRLRETTRDERWKLIVNAIVETDL